jgi:hypothetical protein
MNARLTAVGSAACAYLGTLPFAKSTWTDRRVNRLVGRDDRGLSELGAITRYVNSPERRKIAGKTPPGSPPGEPPL